MRCWSQRRTAAPFEPIPTETVVKRLSVLRPRCAAAKVLPRRNSQPERRKRHVRQGDCQSKNPPQAAMTNNDSAKASATLPIKAMEGKASRTACSSQWRLIPYLVSRYSNLIKIKRQRRSSVGTLTDTARVQSDICGGVTVSNEAPCSVYVRGSRVAVPPLYCGEHGTVPTAIPTATRSSPR
jgi:hypothetical protein